MQDDKSLTAIVGILNLRCFVQCRPGYGPQLTQRMFYLRNKKTHNMIIKYKTVTAGKTVSKLNCF